MPAISHPSTVKKIGAIYSWLIRQPDNFVYGVKCINDAEKLYDAYAMAGVENIYDKYDPAFAIAAIGYDPALNNCLPTSKKRVRSVVHDPS